MNRYNYPNTNYRDRTNEIYGDWKVTSFASTYKQPSGKPNNKWNVQNIKTGECKVMSHASLLYRQKDYTGYRKQYYARHKEQIKAINLENYYKNYERENTRHREYYEANKERISEYGRNYIKNRDKSLLQQANDKYLERQALNLVNSGSRLKQPTTTLGAIYSERYGR